MPFVFGFELIVVGLMVFVLIYAPIKMLGHVFRTISLHNEAKKRYPNSMADRDAYFKEHIYK